MPAYLVRLTDNKELVGIFWANSMKSLFWCIDEACDPYACEALKLQDSGLFYDRTIAIHLPIDVSKMDDELSFYANIASIAGDPTFGDCLQSDFSCGKRWRSISDLMRSKS